MIAGNRRVVVAAAVLAGGVLLFLLAQSFAPKKRGGTKLAPDSFARAVSSADPVLFEKSVSERLDVNAAGAHGRTALVIATQQHNREAIDRLLALGADVDAADENGFTPLMLAAVGGDVELLKIFVARSQKLDARDSTGRTAAHHAILARRYEALEVLLSAGERLGSEDLLPIACEVGDARILAAVLERSSGAREWTPDTRRVLSLALTARDDLLLHLLLSKHVGVPTVEGSTIPLLAQTIVEDDLDAFRALLAAGADPNTLLPLPPLEKPFLSALPSPLRDYAKIDPNMTVLMVAAGMGKADFIRSLLDAGADKYRKTTRYKMLALYFATKTNKSKCIQMLLGSGPAPDKLRLEISLRTQRVKLIKNGEPIFEAQCSTGRDGFATKPGEYVITDKKRDHISSIYKVAMPYFMRLNCLDFGMHQGVVPRYPASHGCIRLPPYAAKKFFSELPVGTVVMIN